MPLSNGETRCLIVVVGSFGYCVRRAMMDLSRLIQPAVACWMSGDATCADAGLEPA